MTFYFHTYQYHYYFFFIFIISSIFGFQKRNVCCLWQACSQGRTRNSHSRPENPWKQNMLCDFKWKILCKNVYTWKKFLNMYLLSVSASNNFMTIKISPEIKRRNFKSRSYLIESFISRERRRYQSLKVLRINEMANAFIRLWPRKNVYYLKIACFEQRP